MVIVEGPSIIAMYKFYNCPYCHNLYFEKYQFELLCYAQLRVDKKPIKSRCSHSHSYDIKGTMRWHEAIQVLL